MTTFYTNSEAAVNPAPPLPLPEWVVGSCPACQGPVVENEYRVGGVGYRTLKNCWNAIGEHPTCNVFDADKYVETHYREAA